MAVGVDVDRLARQVPVLRGVVVPVRVIVDHRRVGESAGTVSQILLDISNPSRGDDALEKLGSCFGDSGKQVLPALFDLGQRGPAHVLTGGELQQPTYRHEDLLYRQQGLVVAVVGAHDRLGQTDELSDDGQALDEVQQQAGKVFGALDIVGVGVGDVGVESSE
ncbi:Uncharacterised protein [Mycobacteroides abscessus subsp. abscessus]|nr:Uncharacterised protein [Mycobacteroides abscessus subsp. abscessus]SIK03191.1 Uncharacterised protein [Mycobacteroides abscessus subsp. abscessus]SIK08336.1 Uncharacterised protein [Mycobacteroides abscessus subsp. abscessus]SIM07381.1 Uncharacterised protein [Mycobacteroides abscessus subsp. abscessus]SIN56846.1 Uncharacterised protein [Mycobacteroides abscessus subsp. abscessus]